MSVRAVIFDFAGVLCFHPADEQLTELPEPTEAVSAINPANQQVTAEASTTDADPTSMATHVRLAKLLDEHGWSGRAVAVLEAARVRFGDKPISGKVADDHADLPVLW